MMRLFLLAVFLFSASSRCSSNELFYYRSDHGYGAVDENGKIVFPPVYSDINKPDYDNGYVALSRDTMYALASTTGRIITPFIYHSIHIRDVEPLWLSDYDHLYFGVEQNGKEGIIDTSGRVVFPCIYLRISYDDDCFSFTAADSTSGIMNANGITIAHLNIDGARSYYGNFVEVVRNNKVGLFDNNGKQLTPFVIDELMIWQGHHNVYRIGKKFGIINDKGTFITPARFQDMDYFFPDGVIGFKEKGKWGLIDTLGKIIVPAQYEEMEHDYEGLVYAKKKGKWGAIDHTGKALTTFDYDDFWFDINYVVCMKKKDKWGMMTKAGELLVEPTYDNISELYAGSGYFLVKQNEKYGLLDTLGKTIVAVKYQAVCDYNSGYALVELNDSIGMIDSSGNVVLPFNYELPEDISYEGKACCFSNEYQVLQKDRQLFIIDKKGKICYSTSAYPYINTRVSENRAIFYSETPMTPGCISSDPNWHQSYGLFDLDKMKLITDLKYDYYYYFFSNGAAIMSINYKFVYVSPEGKEIPLQ
ncbi:MAG TPA: WG repeat-containing protein [Bacteroidia bacterium]|jgi:hypothetical protein|nr:WG repeat-containing protein [Bacteroidia bacterium]